MFDLISTYDPVADKWTDISDTSGYDVWPRKLAWASDMGVLLGAKGANGACGAVYSPAKDAWTGIKPPDSTACRYEALVVSIGARVFVWGGALEPNGSAVNTGWLYDPVADTWTPTTTKGAPSARTKPSGLWTGTEVILWEPSSFGAGDSASYDPDADSWRPIASPGPALDPSPFSNVLPTPAWGDDRMYVWDGSIQKGAVYDVSHDEWTMMSEIGAPLHRANPAVIWTGSELMVWGGRYLYGETNEGWLYSPPPAKK
ncbi:MAG: hypothetical protein HY898_27855 [Deltaproteobacteria bacterium]|nr:hypothetical protein [Deltaproteobacteria bacterium]